MPAFDYEEFWGKPEAYLFDPPSCPAERFGEPINILEVPAELYRDEVSGPDEDSPTKHEVWMTYGERDKDGYRTDTVNTDAVTLEAGDPLLAVVEELDGKPDDPRIERARQAFCDRVLRCKGPVNGECWALGRRAVDEVLRQAFL